MFKNGLVKYENINTKKEIILHPTLSIKNLQLNMLEINIPDEKSNLVMNIQGITIELFFSEISENKLEEIIISEKKELKEKFIKDLFIKITKKDESSSFIKGLIENIIKKIINGMKINIKDFEILIKFKNFEFLIKITNFDLIIENKELQIDFNDFSISHKNNSNDNDNNKYLEEKIINKANINAKLAIKDNENKNEENKGNPQISEKSCQLKIFSSNIKININENILKSLFEIINLYRDIEYSKIYQRYKKLIFYHKPKKLDNNDKNKNYRLLWLYAINTVIKLKKFKFKNKYNIFELLNSTQKKIIEKNINNENDDYILLNDLNILYSTKNIIEKKIIDSKESLANKFFSFFSSNKTEEEKNLTNEEKEMLEDAYKYINLEKYIIKRKFEENNTKNELIEKIKKYLLNFDLNANIEKITIIFNSNLNNNNNIFLNNIYFYFKYSNNNFNFNIITQDIGKNENESFCKDITPLEKDKIEHNNYLIKIEYDKNKLNFNLGKKVEIPENILYFIICYISYIVQSIITFQKRYIFNKNKNPKKELNPIDKKLEINIPYLPSFTLLTNDNNKINFEISDYSWNDELISFKLKINNLNNILIDNYQFSISIDKSNKKYTINLEKPLNINIDKQILENLIINFKNINNSIFTENNCNCNSKLFNIKFVKEINSIKNISLFNNNINLIINEANFIIKDRENETSIKVKNLNFIHENKSLSLIANEIFLEYDLLSLQPIIKELNEIKAINIPDNCIYKYNYINALKEITKDIKIDINHLKAFFYIDHKNYYINLITKRIKGYNDTDNNQIINFMVNDIDMNWVYVPDTLKIIDSKNITLNIRIDQDSNLAFKLYIESPIISLIFLVYNFQDVSEFIKNFFKLKVIYEIKITNIKTEIYDAYLNNPEEKIESGITINMTNYKKIKENNQIDLMNLEKYELAYKLESYTNLIFKLNGKNLKFFGSQRDVSFLFFSVLKPSNVDGKDKNKNESNLLESIDLEVNLYRIKVDFHLEKSYDIVFFDFNLGNLLLNLNILIDKISNFNLGLDKIQMNYYENCINSDKKAPITILNYEISKENDSIENLRKRHEERKQIEIKKDLNNKINIIINKVNILFKYDIILSIYYYYNDISVFDLILSFLKNNKENKNLEINEKEANNTDIQIIFYEVEFKFLLDYLGQRNCIYLYFNQFDFSYLKIINNLIIDQSFRISLNNIKLKNNKRNLIFSKDEYLLLVLNIKKNNNYSIISNSLFNSLTINLNNKDIIIFYKIILDILKLFQIIIDRKNKNLLIKENSIDNNNKRKDSFINSIINSIKINSIISEINIESINIILLDDNLICSENIYNYYPFLNINLYKIKFNYEYNNITNEKYPDIAFNSNHNVLVNYYNDNIKIWEPLTEDLIIKLEYIIKKENNHLIDNYTLEINKLNLNISDEFINILFIRLINWLYDLNKQYKYAIEISKINKINKLNNSKSINKNNNILLKYAIHNYTDLYLIINYENKKYILNQSNKINIEYDNENIYESNNNLNKFIILEYKNNEKYNKILLFPEDFGIKQFKLNIDNIEKEYYIETKKNKEKFIDIFIINPIIIKNKTNYSFKMELNNEKENKQNIINIYPNSIVGLPINYIINKETNFKLELNKDENIKTNSLTDLFYLKDLISNDLNQKINKDIIFKDSNICLSLISKMKLEKYRELIISHKYCIINCLPCSLYIPKNTEADNDDNVEIKKNSLYNIDDLSLLIQNDQRSSIKLKIKIADNIFFYSKLSLMRNETKKLIKFTSANNKEKIILPILIKETFKTKAIIIYSEYILYNSSGIELNISSQDENDINYFYNVGNNIFLISYEIKANSYICLKSNKNIFITNYLKYEDIKNEKLFEFTLNIEDKLNTNQYNFDLIININISNLFCENDKNNIINKIKEIFDLIITIYRIIPKYNIINCTKNIKKEKNNNINLIIKQNKKYYLGININNYEEIKEINNFYRFDNLALNSLYTICIGEKLYNVEVKKAKKGGYKDIFIFNNNLKHSQVLVENKTNYDICLKQKKYEKYKQIVQKNQTQILKIYEQSRNNFSAQIDNKLYYFDLNEIEEKHIINDLYLNIEQNINSKKIIFYIKNRNEDIFQKSKSVMDLPKIIYNRFKMNFTHEKYLKINIILNHINISIIGQNNKNNKDYERKEIALSYIDDLQCGIKLSKTKNIYEIKINVKINNFQIYNLLMNNISCLSENTNSPLINVYSEINYDVNKNRIRILELVNKIGDIRLNIAPIFLKEAYLFIKNIVTNIKLNNLIIDNIFLTKNRKNKIVINTNNIKENYHPLSLIIDKIDISDIKIRFKINKEGIETLPKVIIDFIEYLKCFPFFAIDKETKTILGKISLEGPFKDIKILIDQLKYTIITQLSKEIVIKVLHPSANEIKDNINNMMGYENKIIHKNTNDKKIMRAKNKRIFFGKNQFLKKYNENEAIIIQRLKDGLKQYKDRYLFDIIFQKNYLIILFDEFLLYINDNDKGSEKKIIYNNIKNVICEKNKIIIKWIILENKDTILEFPDENVTEKIYNFLMNFSNN